MEDYQVTNLSDQTQKILKPFLQDILAYCKEDILSISVIGSAVTKDFHPKYSDINTLMIVKEIKVSLFDFIAILGKRYGKKKVCAPLIMTNAYIKGSLDVFPLEFLEMKLIHQLVYGNDVFKDMQVKKADVRLQCERELKGKLQHICQSYIKAMGNRTVLTKLFAGLHSRYFPVLRGLLFLYDQKIPQGKGDVIFALEKCFNIDMSVYRKLMEISANNTCPSSDVLREIFEKLYHLLETVIKKVDEFEIKPV